MKFSKYRAIKSKDFTTGKVFHSKKEHKRALDLRILEKKGDISDLQEQRKFQLLETFKDSQGVTERGITYCADFVYFDRKKGMAVVEDVKSPITKEDSTYIIKRKLFKVRYPEFIFLET